MFWQEWQLLLLRAPVMWQGAAEVAAEALMLKQARMLKLFAEGADVVAGEAAKVAAEALMLCQVWLLQLWNKFSR